MAANKSFYKWQHITEIDSCDMSTELATHGCAAQRLAGYPPEAAEAAFAQLLIALSAWYEHHLAIALQVAQPPRHMCFSTEAHLAELLDSKWRKNNLSAVESKAVRRAFDGNGNSQFQPWLGWRFSGFGITNHMRGLACALESFEPASQALADLLQCPVDEITTGGMPHPLLKPPSGTEGMLKPHVDGGVTLRTIWGWTADTDPADWAYRHGVQTLVHLRGAGPQDTGGHTIGLRGLTVHRYYVLLAMLCPEHPHPEAPAIPFDETDGGPIFGAFFNPRSDSPFLLALNRVLAAIERDAPADAADRAWIASLPPEVDAKIARCRASPSTRRVVRGRICPDAPGPYLAVWLLGFPHGSTPAGTRARLTINLNLRRGSSDAGTRKRKRGCQRTLNLLAGDLAAVRADTAVYEGGRVHLRPGTEVDNFPFFKPLYATRQQIESFDALCDRRGVQPPL
jgi:hypothetical protein